MGIHPLADMTSFVSFLCLLIQSYKFAIMILVYSLQN